MDRVKIKIVSIGHLPVDLKLSKITEWKSSLFKIVGEVDNYSLRCDSDSYGWEFSDSLVKNQLPTSFDADFLIAVVNVPIEDNWYSRRLGDNKVVFTLHHVKEILDEKNIPLVNVIYRLLYAYTILYKRSGNKIPDFGDAPGFTHDETRGCLFDMNGIKADLVASCHKPIICEECQERLRRERVSNEVIERTLREILRIKKDLYYRILGFLKKHPIWSIFLSSLFALILGVMASVMASFIYDEINLGRGVQVLQINDVQTDAVRKSAD